MEITDALIASISSLERLGNTRGGGDGRGTTAAMDFKVDYHDLPGFLEALEGKEELVGNVRAKVPLRFPDFAAGTYDLFAVRYSWRSVGMRRAFARPDPADPDPPTNPGLPPAPGPAGTGWNATHVHAEVTVEFGRPDFAFSDSVMVSRRNRIGARVVTIPGAAYKYAPTASLPAAGKPIGQDTGVVIPTQEVRLTRHWVPDIDEIEAEMLPLIYHTNETAMQVGGKLWQPGCVLFSGMDTDEQRGGFGGAISRRVDYSVLIEPLTWDVVMSDITGRFEPVVSSLDSAVRIYPRGPIGQMLTL